MMKPEDERGHAAPSPTFENFYVNIVSFPPGFCSKKNYTNRVRAMFVLSLFPSPVGNSLLTYIVLWRLYVSFFLSTWYITVSITIPLLNPCSWCPFRQIKLSAMAWCCSERLPFGFRASYFWGLGGRTRPTIRYYWWKCCNRRCPSHGERMHWWKRALWCVKITMSLCMLWKFQSPWIKSVVKFQNQVKRIFRY